MIWIQVWAIARRYTVSKNQELCIKKQGIVYQKTRNCVFQTRDFVFKMMSFAGLYQAAEGRAKIMNFVLQTRKCVSKSRTNKKLCIKNEEFCIQKWWICQLISTGNPAVKGIFFPVKKMFSGFGFGSFFGAKVILKDFEVDFEGFWRILRWILDWNRGVVFQNHTKTRNCFYHQNHTKTRNFAFKMMNFAGSKPGAVSDASESRQRKEQLQVWMDEVVLLCPGTCSMPSASYIHAGDW